MPPPSERWVRWGRWYAVIAAIGLLAGAVWGIGSRPVEHTESTRTVPGPETTKEVRVPLLPGATPGPKSPGWLLRSPEPTKTVTASPKPPSKTHETGPDGRKGVMPSGSTDGGSSTGSSPGGGADAESVAPSPEA